MAFVRGPHFYFFRGVVGGCPHKIPTFVGANPTHATMKKQRPIEHILVVRLTDVAKAAMCVHALRGLKRDYPNIKLTVLTSSTLLPLFQGVAGLEFLLADDAKYKGLFGGVKLWSDIQRLKVDGVADLEASPRSRRLRFSPTPWRRITSVIERGKIERKLLTRKFRKVMVQLSPLSQRSRDVFERLGLPFSMPAPVRRKRSSKPPHIATILAGEKSGRWIGVALLSHRKGNCYPIDQSAELIKQLAARYEKVFVFGSGTYQKQFCEGMESLFPSVVSVAERASLSEQMELISVLDAVITVDHPVLSLASLVGTPAISIWGATHPFIESCGYGQNPTYAVQVELPCRPCSADGRRACLFGHYECMTRISPEMVLARLLKLFR